MKKNPKTLVLGLLGVVVLALQTFTSLSADQITSLSNAVQDGIAVLATLTSLWGVIKSHDKKVEAPVVPAAPVVVPVSEPTPVVTPATQPEQK